MRVVCRWILLVGLSVAVGCAPGGVAPGENREPSQEEVARDSGSRNAAGVVAEDYWEAVFFQNSQVGHIHTRRERIEEDGRALWRTVSETRIELLRFGDKSSQESTYESVEQQDGRLVRFATESAHGASPVRSAGAVANGKLTITTTIGDRKSASELNWPADGGGFDAVNKSLLRDPLQPGERRTLKSLVPGLDQPTPATVELVASDWESVSIDGEPRQLLRVDARHQLPGDVTMHVAAWVSDRGEIIKTEPAPGMYTVRSTAEAAQHLSQRAAQADIGRDQFVRLAAPAGDLHRALRAKYRVQLKEGSPARTFPAQRSQQVEATDDPHAAMLTVTPLRPESMTVDRDPTPDNAFRASNPLVQSDDPRVKELAAQAVAGAADDAARAAAIERFAHEFIEEVSFSQAFATATDVLASRRGDCTEHAVLVASLARAVGLPARVAVGLVYTQSNGQAGFAYHMWNELYVDGQWIAYDATLGLGGIGGGHIKLSDSHLAEGTALASFLPVVQVMGRLRIEVVAVDAP